MPAPLPDPAPDPAHGAPPPVAVEAIDKSFAAPVLRGVSAEFRAGEIHAILGMNGAGKSTLMKIIAGALTPDQGVIRVAGQPMRFRHPREALAEGIAMVYQELDLAPHLSVAANLLLGAEPGRRGGRLDAVAERRAAQRLLDDCGIALDPARPLRDLRTGERQQVAIAKGFYRARRLLILDEPTSALNAAEVEALFQLLERLRQQGLAMIYISHRFEELARIAGRVTVLRNGQVALSISATQGYSWPAIAAAMVGEAVGVSRAGAAPPPESPVRYALRGATLRGHFTGLDLSIRAGEVVGLAGIAGDGRAALAECIFGLRRFDCGEVRLDGQPATARSCAEAVSQGLGFIPEDRARAICPHLPATANATLASVSAFASWWRLRPRREAAIAAGGLRASGVAETQWPLPARALSGGTQQKLLFARWVAQPSRLLVLNEPTRGVDIRARRDIHQQITARLRSGAAVLVISSDLEELLQLCHRVLILRRGRLGEELSGDALTREAILLASAGAAAADRAGAAQAGKGPGA
ncbi:MAG: sugar ABC transporter ATP-binding protein [Terriglobales bacterium]